MKVDYCFIGFLTFTEASKNPQLELFRNYFPYVPVTEQDMGKVRMYHVRRRTLIRAGNGGASGRDSGGFTPRRPWEGESEALTR